MKIRLILFQIRLCRLGRHPNCLLITSSYRMIGLGRLCMCMGSPRGLPIHEQSQRPRPDKGLAANFASFAIIWVALLLYSRMGRRKIVDPGLPRKSCTKGIS